MEPMSREELRYKLKHRLLPEFNEKEFRDELKAGPIEAHNEEMRGRMKVYRCANPQCTIPFVAAWLPCECPRCGTVLK